MFLVEAEEGEFLRRYLSSSPVWTVGVFSNEFPFILKDSFSESHPNTRVRESLLETFKASYQSQSAPSRPEKVEPSSVVRPSQAALGSKRDFQGELSSSSRPVAKAKGPTPIQVSLRYTPRFPRSPTFVSFFERQRPGRETYFGLQRSRGQVASGG